MRLFQPYVDHLNAVVQDLASSRADKGTQSSAIAVINGHSNQVLKNLVPTDELRSQGVFFSSADLADLAAANSPKSPDASHRILDPMCGSGDLLLACARRLPLGKTLRDTMAFWGKYLHGRDLHSEFINATKARLVLLAMHRHHFPAALHPRQISHAFPNIKVGCGVSNRRYIRSATHIMLNPPFHKVSAPIDCTWGGGNVNSAALIFEAYVRTAKPETRIVAILPDVLRSGSRYATWREEISRACRLLRVEVFGRFDHLTDVDVFLVDVQVRSPESVIRNRSLDWIETADGDETIGDYFSVRVGPLVNYRTPKKGKWQPYLQSHELPAWTELREIQSNRRFKGALIETPFVAVRRTSRPEDRFRAVGSIIATRKPVAVENHLLVLEPKKKTLKQCRQLIDMLRDPRTNDWLNNRIRCRHLTTASVRDIPWWKK